MPPDARPRVRLVARTEFLPPDDVPWTTDASGGQALAEFAGRACYQSWSKPIPATATNAGYLDHILQVGHLSVLEHSTATFYITEISRSVTHELIRHRHFSYSQLSQRYLPPDGPEVVEPDLIAADPTLHERFIASVSASAQAYAELLEALETAAAQAPDGTLARKQARQAARAVLPNATATAVPSGRALTRKSANTLGANVCSSTSRATARARISMSAASVARMPMKCRHAR